MTGHWQTTTMMAAIALDGVQAPFVLEGAVDAEAFGIYIERVLLLTPHGGEIVVLDNLAGHKHPRIRKLIESAGAELWYLPPYSPDFNPIEQMWFKIKQTLRSLAARTFEGLIHAIGIALEEVTKHDLVGWFTHCGYTT